ncbi:hypothetical protein L873DRAFT_278381 [Choiromyces venosus 120613-1]|uniref:Uncharacterized protein n=1 Tax=Choiromyces venosus 120613-1 TaxID=1336337 RepID=A0A3N4KAZ2_9PEZI|nr:hypothetical protein L873DRAFT_278381 [Choiromyces venosus 120613-1]
MCGGMYVLYYLYVGGRRQRIERVASPGSAILYVFPSLSIYWPLQKQIFCLLPLLPPPPPPPLNSLHFITFVLWKGVQKPLFFHFFSHDFFLPCEFRGQFRLVSIFIFSSETQIFPVSFFCTSGLQVLALRGPAPLLAPLRKSRKVIIFFSSAPSHRHPSIHPHHTHPTINNHLSFPRYGRDKTSTVLPC